MPIPQSPYNAMLAGQDPSAMLQLSNRNASNLGQTASNLTPYQQFGLKLMQLLKQQQTLGTKPFVEAQLTGQEEQARRIMQQAQPGMPPNLQAQVRGASAQAMEPTIQGAATMGKTFGEQISGMGNAISQAQNLLAYFEESQSKAQTQAQGLLENIMTLGDTESLKGFDQKQLAQIEKLAGYPQGFTQKMTEKLGQSQKMAEQKQQLELQKLQKEIQNIGIKAPTESDIVAAELPKTEIRLMASRGKDNFIDPNIYKQERSKSRIAPEEFDARFGSFLNPKDRKDVLGIGTGKALSPVETGKVAALKDINDALNSVENIYKQMREKKIQIGPIASKVAGVKRFLGVEDKLRNELFTATSELSDRVLRARSGAQINEQEYARMMNFLPNIKQQEGTFEINLNNFRKVNTETLKNRLDTFGQTGYDVSEIASGSFTLMNPKNGEIKQFTDLTPEELMQALSSGFYLH